MSENPSFHRKHCSEVADTCLAFTVRRADRMLTQLYDKALKGTGLRSTQFTVLVAIRAMEPVTLSELATYLGLDRTTLTRNLKLLEADHLVLNQSGEDRRQRQLTVAPKGHEALHVALPRWRVAQKTIEDRLGRAAMKTLLQDLEELADE